MVLVFWLSCAIIAYVYAGYPLLLGAWAKRWPRPVVLGRRDDASLPGISIIIAVRNEGHHLARRIDNLLALDYPADKRQIVVVSDGSTDATLDLLAERYPEVDVVAVPAGGKARALNAGVAMARFDLLGFADARQVFAPDSLTELVRPFSDPEVGVVTGELLLDSESSGRRIATSDRRIIAGSAGPASGDQRVTIDRRHAGESTIAEGVGWYWRYEKRMRRLESTVGSTLGATGAIYAMRRTLWRPLPPDTILDDVLAPMRCVLAGYRSVFVPSAQAFDRTAPDAASEARRKRRTLAGNYQILWLEPALLLPWRNPVWLQYASHKIGRLVVPYMLVATAVASVALARESLVYAVALAGQCAFYLLAAYGAWLDRQGSTGMRSDLAALADDRGALNA